VIEQFPGTVQAIRESVVSARITAEVRDVLKRPGNRVSSSDVLVILDSRDLQARELQAREELSGAEARFREAELNYNRMKEVLDTGAIARNLFDAAEASYLATRSAMENARQRLEEAQVNLTYATIRAPFDAVVVDRFVEPGDVASPGLPLLKVYDPERMRLEAFVRESMAVKLKPGDAVDVSLEALTLRVQGSVEEIVPQAEAGSRSFLVKVGLPARERLYPGMFGRLLLGAGQSVRVLVPQEALVEVGQLRFVIMADAAGSRRLVIPGAVTADGNVEILSGLRGGEEILVPGAR
jgi:RND family efflux transporter MFP subunit